MIRIVGVWFDGGHDRIDRNESRDVVDVAIRIVTDDPIPQPENRFDPKMVTKLLLDLSLRQMWIAVRIQQARIRRQQ